MSIMISGREIGIGHPCFIVAEAGVNHNGDLKLARQLIDIAVQAGADAVKFQTFQAERLTTRDAPKSEYELQTTDVRETHYDMLHRLELSEESHNDLITYCKQQGIIFLSTPFDEDSANMLADLGVSAFKTSSGEITNLPLLAHIARKEKPMIVSTGMAKLGEVEDAIQTIESTGNNDIVLLHCVSNYPADPSEVNLRAMQTIAAAFQVDVGYSDHTPGVEVALAAVALGACVIEKHITLNKKLPGPDHQASLEPHEIKSMVHGIRMIEAALGKARKQPVESEANTASVTRKSLVAAKTIPSGTRVTRDMIVVRRPGTGLPPTMMTYVVGRTVREEITEGSLIKIECLL